MRRIAFIFAGIFMLSCNSFAQLPFSLGLKVGFNSSKMPTEFSSFGEVKDQAKTGFLAGAFGFWAHEDAQIKKSATIERIRFRFMKN